MRVLLIGFLAVVAGCGAGVTVGKELWADSLGPEGSDGATYIGSIEANTRALVEGFTGQPANCTL